jgi:hypothetical protein
MTRNRVWVVFVVLVSLSACSGKKREFAEGLATGGSVEVGALTPDAMAPTGSGVSGVGEASSTAPTLLPTAPSNEIPPGALGAACATSAECDAPGQCVVGVCCSSACTELCAACNVPGSVGTCSAAPSDEACGELLCAGVDTECRKLDTAQLALNCDGFAACKVNAECAVAAEAPGTACQAGSGSCDGDGACLVPGKASLGEACVDDDGCAEGHCVAGEGGALICCDAACDSPCQACSPAGHCEQTPATDARCEAVACPADDVCRDYTADVTASQCRAFGQCQAALDCPRVALRPDAECECDASTGVCRLRPGAACADAEQCASGVCTSNGQGTAVCCASACAAGLFCSGDGAGCVGCEGSAVECDGNTERRCNAGSFATTACANGCTPGTGCNTLPPLGFLCDGGQCSSPNVCQTDVTGASRCCSRDCAVEGKVCAENGSCACQEGQIAAGSDCLLQDGDPCQTSQQCQVGSACTDGVCCQEACNGTCERCEPNTGLCVAIGAGLQDTTCANGRQCTGARGDCRLGVRQPCTANGAECTTNSCEPTVGNATQICCSETCAGNSPFCRSNGQGCVQCETGADCGNGCNTQTGLCNDLLPIGTPCGVDAQCDSDNCGPGRGGVAAVCCSVTCQPGFFCSADGQRCVQCDGSAGGAAQCPVGCDVTRGVCNSLAANGQSCGADATCASQICEADSAGVRRCCFAECQALGEVCNTMGTACVCPSGRARDVDGACKLQDGQSCANDGDCINDVCRAQFTDDDGDGFGRADSQPVLTCGDLPVSGRVFDGTDCCDSDATAFPQVNGLYHTGISPCGSYDFNCDGDIERIDGTVLAQNNTASCLALGCR